MKSTIRSVGLVCVAWLFACAPGGGGGGGGTIELRPGAKVLWEGRVTSEEEEVVCNVVTDTCLSDRLRIMDAARDGNRIVVTARGMWNVPHLFISEDLGDTWSHHQLPSSFDRVEGNRHAGSSWFYGVHAHQGRIWLAVSGSRSTQDVYPILRLMEVSGDRIDYEGDVIAALDALYFEGFQVTQATTILAPDQGSQGYGNVFRYAWDLSTGKAVEGASASYPVDPTTTRAYQWTSVDGRTWYGMTDTMQWDGPQQQRLHCAVITSPTMGLTSFCRPRLLSPIPFGTPPQLTRLGRGIWQLYERDGHVFAAAPTAQVGLPFFGPVYLGQGHVGGETYTLTHPRHAGFAVVNPLADDVDAAPQLRRFNEDGSIDTVLLPHTPCVDPKKCGESLKTFDAYGDVQLLVPLDGGEYLSLHLIDRAEGFANGQVLIATRDRPEFVPFRDTPPVFDDLLPGWPGAKGPSRFERACVKAMACGVSGGNMVACLSSRSTLAAGTEALDTAFTDFLDAADQPGCSAFTTPRPLWSSCTVGCMEGIAVQRCPEPNSPFASFMDCRAFRKTCVVDDTGPHCGAPIEEESCVECISRDGGAECLDVPECAEKGFECRGDVETAWQSGCGRRPCPVAAKRCEDGVAGWCGNAGAAESCGRLDRACNAEGTACEPIYADRSQCPVPDTQCQGDFFVWCRADGVRAVDCKALGFRGCESRRFYVEYTEGGCVR